MTTQEIVEHLKGQDKLIESMRVDLQLLIWESNSVAADLERSKESPGGSAGHIKRVYDRIESICNTYGLEPKSRF